MPILLFTDAETCIQAMPALLDAHGDEALAVLLTAGEPADGELPTRLRAALPDLAVVDVLSPRFGRLNFDAVGVAVLDMPTDFLAGSAGRRLMDVLGHLAAETLALVLIGGPAALAGGLMLDGVHAGLRLIPETAVIPDMKEVGDLRALLSRISAQGARLLALDAPVGVRYDVGEDRVRVSGRGSVLLATFVAAAEPAPEAPTPAQTARLHVLTDGLAAGWPG